MISGQDREELLDLIHRYACHADNKEIVDLAGLFTEDGVLMVPDPPRTLLPESKFKGRQQIADRCAALRTITATMHAIVGHTFFTIDASARGSNDPHVEETELLRGSVSCIANHVRTRNSGEHVNTVWYLIYDDVYRRVGGRWYIQERRARIKWIEEHRPAVVARTIKASR